MTSADDARALLGVGPGADRAQLRAAYRRRIRALHPDVSGDDSPAGQAAAREVLEAYRRLCRDLEGGRPEPAPVAIDEPVPSPEPPDIDHGPSPRLVQVAVASLLIVVAIASAVFVLIAFTQSGR